MKQKFDYDTALEYMRNGAITSNDNGKYDYYKIENSMLYGCYSCDGELFKIDSLEQEQIENAEWYLITHNFDIHIVENLPFVSISFAYPFSEETNIFSEKVAKICNLENVLEHHFGKPFTQESIKILRFEIENQISYIANKYGISDYKKFLQHLYNGSSNVKIHLDIN